MRNSGKTLLILLLLTALVVQPVMFAYAMAGVGHHHGDSHTMMGGADEMHHSSATHTTGTMHHHTNTASRDHGDDHGSLLDDCCATPACGGAPISSFTLELGKSIQPGYQAITLSWTGIIIPSEVKPPRRQFG